MTKPIPTDAQMALFRDEWYKDADHKQDYNEYLKNYPHLKENQMKADDVQISGSHYKDMGIQPWAVMEAVLTREEFIGYLKGNVIKYAMRQGKKVGSDDSNKARHYSVKLAEVQNGTNS